MQELDDNGLLREYVEHDSEEAFATLVARHINKVYSVALRHTRNPHQAEEITQAVFVILARKSRHLGRRVVLSGWLYQTARLTARTSIRSDIRRTHREQEAYMQTLLDETASGVWPQIAPLLDAAMDGLSEADRHAVVLRFFDGKSMKEVGTALGASEDAAKMRLNRAVEKLRLFFTKRGIVHTSEVLTATISAHSVQTAPVALAKTVATVAFAKGAAASGSTLTLIKGALKVMAWTQAKTIVGVSVVIILAAGTTTTLVVRHPHLPRPQPIMSEQTEFPKASWVFAGYADPRSALMSYLWTSTCQSDRKIFEASLTPAEKLVYQHMITLNMKVPQLHSEAETVADTFRKAHDQWQNGSYRIIDQADISANQVLLHLEAQNSGKKMEVSVKMKKTGGEWKFDGIEKRKIIAASEQP